MGRYFAQGGGGCAWNIASTDESRIGSYHGGAAKIAAENLDELRIFRDDEYAGTRRGTNFLQSC